MTRILLVALAVTISALGQEKVKPLTALDYMEIQQLNYKYAFALDTCSNHGEDYANLRGVMLECDVVVHRDIAEVVRLGAEIMTRNSVPRDVQAPTELPPEARDAVAAQAGKRVGLEFVELRRVSWDHRKLGGVY